MYHDEGNLNYSVICPSADFTRNKHAHMVSQALNNLGASTRVNERHDIVLDLDGAKMPLKISGSAYKLSKARALHHGTCLLYLSNPDLFHDYLTSPARPYIKALGVESVRSPVGSVSMAGVWDPLQLETNVVWNVIRAFARLYSLDIEVDKLEQMVRRQELVAGRGVYGTDWLMHIIDQESPTYGGTEVQAGIEELRVSLFERSGLFILTWPSSHWTGNMLKRLDSPSRAIPAPTTSSLDKLVLLNYHRM